MSLWHSLTDPKVPRHLISDEGEIVVDEVQRHPVAYIIPTLLILLGLGIMVSTFWVPLGYAWAPLSLGLLTGLFGGYRALAAHMDRFVITNMRVFRVHGIFAQHTATMPMARILDISVHKPFIGRIFRYGHFVFESAAQDQGLRDIRFVGRPDERDLTIQRVIQRSGLRKSMQPPAPDKESADSAEDEALTPDSEVDQDTGSWSEETRSDRTPEDSDTGEWNTLEIETQSDTPADSEEIRRRRLRSDPIAAAATAWEQLWPERPRMEAVTSLMRVHRLLITELDDLLRPLGLSFARYEALLLLSLAPRGALPLVELTEQLQVQATSATSMVKQLEDNGLINRALHSDDDGEVYAEITPKGLKMTERSSAIIADARFGLGSLSESESQRLTDLLSWPRMAAGDF